MIQVSAQMEGETGQREEILSGHGEASTRTKLSIDSCVILVGVWISNCKPCEIGLRHISGIFPNGSEISMKKISHALSAKILTHSKLSKCFLLQWLLILLQKLKLVHTWKKSLHWSMTLVGKIKMNLKISSPKDNCLAI